MSSEPGNESFFCALRPIPRIRRLQDEITRVKLQVASCAGCDMKRPVTPRLRGHGARGVDDRGGREASGSQSADRGARNGAGAGSVAQRTREIGLRMALGASPGRVRRMVLGQGAMMTLVGGLVGLAGALGVGKGAQSILFQMTGADPAVLALSVVALALVALCAGFIPALRASRVDPMRALKYE